MKEKDKVFCIDQGGGKSQVNITEDTSPTLTTTHGGEPAGKGMAGYGVEVSPTLASESHGTPHAVCYGLITKGNGECILSEEHHTALSTEGGHVGQEYPAVVYGISAYDSNAMKSSNPHSGIYEADTSRTLDLNGGSPACNQGGMMVVAFTQNEREEVRDLGDKSSSLSAESGTHQQTYVLENHPNDSRLKIREDNTFQTLSGRMGTGGNNTPMVLDMLNLNPKTDDICQTLNAYNGTGGNNMPMVMNVSSNWDGSQISPTLTANIANGAQRMPDKENFNAVISYGVDSYNQTQSIEQAKTLNSAATDSDHIPCTYTQGGNIHMNWEEIYATTTRNPILCILQETYGTQKVFEWGIAVLATLQSADLLQSRVYESGIPFKTENGYMLDDSAQICSTIVAKWLLRDMRKQQECGCSSQGQESSEQRDEQFNESMSKLSQQTPPSCKDLFNMWEKGEGLWLLRQALSEVQEIWQSFNGKRQSVHTTAIVRRLTPTECSRLQNFPDGWCDIGEWVDENGKKHKDADAPKYKALGNSIALPFWQWLAYRVVDQLKEDGVENPTMASLFSGIGGFELVYTRAGCLPIWNSEIEPYPIAVCKKHFGDEETGEVGDVEKYL